MQFSELSLHIQLAKTIEHFGFKTATEIQQRAIPVVLAGKDLIASSKTGSGKTLAYLLPVLHKMLTSKPFSKRDPRAVILAPTRELANQVYAQVRACIANTQFTAVKLIGGDNFNDQAKMLRKQPRVIVATPGRLVDHLNHRHLYLNGLECLVFDEADRMLDLGFAEQLKVIHQAADHRKRQTLMFSATMDDVDTIKMSEELLNSPARVAIGAAHDEHQDISQKFYLADHLDHKKALLGQLLQDIEQQAIVFTATRDDTDNLATWLSEQGVSAVAISGNLSQSKRNQVIDEFARARQQVLVTTDIAARGLDLRHVGLVVNFDLPKHAEEYVHRIGRTGRAGFQGAAASLVSRKDWKSFEQIQIFLQKNISFSLIEGFEAQFKGFEPKQKKTNSTNKVRKNKPKANSGASNTGANRNQPRKKPAKIISAQIDVDAPPIKRKPK